MRDLTRDGFDRVALDRQARVGVHAVAGYRHLDPSATDLAGNDHSKGVPTLDSADGLDVNRDLTEVMAHGMPSHGLGFGVVEAPVGPDTVTLALDPEIVTVVDDPLTSRPPVIKKPQKSESSAISAM